MFKFNSKSALVTGGASGIGRETALLLAKQGATVYILDVDKQAAESTIAASEGAEGQIIFKRCDIGHAVEVETVVQDILKTTQHIDILVNNAGISHIGTIENTTVEELDRLLNINVKGAFNVTKSAIEHMKAKGGVIINLASVASLVGLPERFAYSVSKGAIVGMTLSIARDFLSHNIRCNCISPARVYTPFVQGYLAKNYAGQEQEMFEKLSATQPIGRMANPEEIAYLILYLCSDEASFITGCDYPIDGGFTRLNN